MGSFQVKKTTHTGWMRPQSEISNANRPGDLAGGRNTHRGPTCGDCLTSPNVDPLHLANIAKHSKFNVHQAFVPPPGGLPSLEGTGFVRTSGVQPLVSVMTACTGVPAAIAALMCDDAAALKALDPKSINDTYKNLTALDYLKVMLSRGILDEDKAREYQGILVDKGAIQQPRKRSYRLIPKAARELLSMCAPARSKSQATQLPGLEVELKEFPTDIRNNIVLLCLGIKEHLRDELKNCGPDLKVKVTELSCFRLLTGTMLRDWETQEVKNALTAWSILPTNERLSLTRVWEALDRHDARTSPTWTVDIEPIPTSVLLEHWLTVAQQQISLDDFKYALERFLGRKFDSTRRNALNANVRALCFAYEKCTKGPAPSLDLELVFKMLNGYAAGHQEFKSLVADTAATPLAAQTAAFLEYRVAEDRENAQQSVARA